MKWTGGLQRDAMAEYITFQNTHQALTSFTFIVLGVCSDVFQEWCGLSKSHCCGLRIEFWVNQFLLQIPLIMQHGNTCLN